MANDIRDNLNTENFTVSHESDCNQTGDLCLCFKRELRRLFKVLEEYQDDISNLQSKLGGKKNGNSERNS